MWRGDRFSWQAEPSVGTFVKTGEMCTVFQVVTVTPKHMVWPVEYRKMLSLSVGESEASWPWGHTPVLRGPLPAPEIDQVCLGFRNGCCSFAGHRL